MGAPWDSAHIVGHDVVIPCAGIVQAVAVRARAHAVPELVARLRVALDVFEDSVWARKTREVLSRDICGGA